MSSPLSSSSNAQRQESPGRQIPEEEEWVNSVLTSYKAYLLPLIDIDEDKLDTIHTFTHTLSATEAYEKYLTKYEKDNGELSSESKRKIYTAFRKGMVEGLPVSMEYAVRMPQPATVIKLNDKQTIFYISFLSVLFHEKPSVPLSEAELKELDLFCGKHEGAIMEALSGEEVWKSLAEIFKKI
jgi:hypothetical protein